MNDFDKILIENLEKSLENSVKNAENKEMVIKTITDILSKYKDELGELGLTICFSCNNEVTRLSVGDFGTVIASLLFSAIHIHKDNEYSKEETENMLIKMVLGLIDIIYKGNIQ